MSAEPPQDRNPLHLVPELRKKVAAILDQLGAEGYRVIISETGRTAERQKWLRAHGKSQRGRSLHQDGRACDFAFIKNGKAVWLRGFPGWLRLGRAAKNKGLRWGGLWKSFKDCPHVELP
jgi:hypothetical protein